ncbi:MAG: peptidylprolyl isomerase [Gammaproteobacteria bacterium]|nr:peptidylprolyl isomerase [Gammaproteobacteria bacterium]
MRTFTAILALVATASVAQETETRLIEIGDRARVRIETSLGNILVELDAIRAPVTVENFLQYVVDDHYDGTIFHRVAPGFLIQGGGYNPDLTLRPASRKVFNESGNGLSNLRGTIGMARSNEPHQADSQFYINLADNSNLDPLPTRWGYAVFGRVVDGMDVVDTIGGVPTGSAGEFDRDVPVEPIVIHQIELIRE